MSSMPLVCPFTVSITAIAVWMDTMQTTMIMVITVPAVLGMCRAEKQGRSGSLELCLCVLEAKTCHEQSPAITCLWTDLRYSPANLA